MVHYNLFCLYVYGEANVGCWELKQFEVLGQNNMSCCISFMLMKMHTPRDQGSFFGSIEVPITLSILGNTDIKG